MSTPHPTYRHHQELLATHFRALHTSNPTPPLILLNAHDIPTTSLLLAHPSTRAIATPSYGIAAVQGLADEELTLEKNLEGVKGIAETVGRFNASVMKGLIEGRKSGDIIPMTVDLQNGYGERLEEAVGGALDLGVVEGKEGGIWVPPVVGCNLEDSGLEEGKLYSVDEACERIRRAVKTAAEKGVPSFVVNARTDTILVGGTVEEAVFRGKRYLEAGATCVFVWGGRARGGITREEVDVLSRELGGRLNVILGDKIGSLTVSELKGVGGGLGVCRVSCGPGLLRTALKAVQRVVDNVLGEKEGNLSLEL